MHYIYPIDETIDSLKLNIEEYYYALNQTPPTIPLKGLRDIVFAAIDDAVNARLLWCEQSPQVENVIAQVFEGYSGDDTDQASGQFYMEALEEELTAVRHWVASTVPKETWNIWFVRHLHGCVHLERGRDYRVVEYERLVETGKVKLPKKVKQRLIKK